MSRGAPVLRWIWSNRWTPRASSRTTSSDHFSPSTFSAAAIEQTRGVVGASTRALCQSGLTFPTLFSRFFQPTHGDALSHPPARPRPDRPAAAERGRRHRSRRLRAARRRLAAGALPRAEAVPERRGARAARADGRLALRPPRLGA